MLHLNSLQNPELFVTTKGYFLKKPLPIKAHLCVNLVNESPDVGGLAYQGMPDLTHPCVCSEVNPPPMENSSINSTSEAPTKTLVQRVAEKHGCETEAAIEILARELQTPSQRFWTKLSYPWSGPFRNRYREVVQDISRCRDLSEIKTSILYWRQRSPETGFLGSQFRVHTAQALSTFDRYRTD